MSFLTKLCKQLAAHQVDYALVGGYAVALHGAIRGTVDIDMIVDWQLDNLKQAEASLKALGLRSLHPINAETVFRDRDTLVNEKNLIAWNFYNPANPAEAVDIITTTNLHDKAKITLLIQDQPINVLGKADLIAMKMASGRQQDMEDIKALKALPDEKV